MEGYCVSEVKKKAKRTGSEKKEKWWAFLWENWTMKSENVDSFRCKRNGRSLGIGKGNIFYFNTLLFSYFICLIVSRAFSCFSFCGLNTVRMYLFQFHILRGVCVVCLKYSFLKNVSCFSEKKDPKAKLPIKWKTSSYFFPWQF